MTRVDEVEVPGVPDTITNKVREILQEKPTVEELTQRIPFPDPAYQPLHHPKRPLQTNTQDLGISQPDQYFNLFVPPEQFNYIAEYTNINACMKRDEQHSEQAGQEFDDGEISDVNYVADLKARPWTNTWGAEIGVFIGVLLLAGINKNTCITEYWSKYTDMGRSPDICSVSPPVRRQKGSIC